MNINKKNSKKVIINYITERCQYHGFNPDIYLNDILKVNGNTTSHVWVATYSDLLSKRAILVNKNIINKVKEKLLCKYIQ